MLLNAGIAGHQGQPGVKGKIFSFLVLMVLRLSCSICAATLKKFVPALNCSQQGLSLSG